MFLQNPSTLCSSINHGIQCWNQVLPLIFSLNLRSFKTFFCIINGEFLPLLSNVKLLTHEKQYWQVLRIKQVYTCLYRLCILDFKAPIAYITDKFWILTPQQMSKFTQLIPWAASFLPALPINGVIWRECISHPPIPRPLIFAWYCQYYGKWILLLNFH